MSTHSATAQNQPEVTCPKCGTAIPLTEALAAPLVQATRAEFEAKLRNQSNAMEQHGREIAERERRATQSEQQLRDREATLKQQEAIAAQEVERKAAVLAESKLEARLNAERADIARAAEQRANARVTERLAKSDQDLKDLHERLDYTNGQLATAQQLQAELKRKEREYTLREQQRPEEIEREVAGRLDQVRAQAAESAGEDLKLQLKQQELKMQGLQKQLEEASRKAAQGSQQTQGETLELLLEDQLGRHFPYDSLQPVPKGESGADILQVVRDSTGRECGRILWEFKRTKLWNNGWLSKLKTDQRAAKADLAVMVSQAMPPDVQHFNEVDGVWVSSLGCTLPVATALRASLLQLALQRYAADGQQTKSEMVYAYLTGRGFRARIEAIAERWDEMQKDLNAERKATLARWAKREAQLNALVTSTTGIWGDLQGIAGRDLQEIAALSDTLLLTSTE